MKKLLMASNVILLCVVAYLLWQYQPWKNGTSTKPLPVDNCEQKICADYNGSGFRGQITGNFAKLLSDNYKRDIAKNFIWDGGNNTTEADARCVWFSLKDLKGFLWQIENNNCKKGCNDSLGVRIYFAKYPDKNSNLWADPSFAPLIDLANHHTVFMLPTYWDRDKNTHFDFDLQDASTCRQPLKKVFDANGKWLVVDSAGYKPSVAMIFTTQIDPNGKNHGGLTPPNDETGLAF